MATSRSDGPEIQVDLSGRPISASTPLDDRTEPFYSVVLAEFGAPSAVAMNELFAWLRPPCAKAEVAPKFSRRASDLTVNEDVPRRRRPLRRELQALQQPFEVIGPQGCCLKWAVAARNGPSRMGQLTTRAAPCPWASNAAGIRTDSCQV
jgi:hypothetical protein